MKKVTLLLLLVSGYYCANAVGDVMSFRYDTTPVNETWLLSSTPTTNYDTRDYLSISYGASDKRVGLINFDISSLSDMTIPDEEGKYYEITVTSATFWAVHYTGSNANALDVGIYQVKREWIDSQATWNNAETGSAWEIAGVGGSTDRASVALDTVTLTNTYGGKEWDLGTDLAQGWVDGTIENYGLALLATSAPSGDTVKNIRGSLTATRESRPLLTIAYDAQLVPEPTTSIMFIGGIAALIKCRKNLKK